MGCCPVTDTGSTQEPGLSLNVLGEQVTAQPSTTPEEDLTLRRLEDSLLFNQHKSAQVCQLLTTHAEAGKLPPQKFHAITTELSLNMKEIDEDGSPMKSFYRKFKEGNKFDATKLKVLAILLGQGTVEEKSGLYFDSFVKGKETMDLEAIQEMLEMVFAVSVDFLPLLGVKDGEEGMSQKEYIEFTFFLGSQKEQIRDRMTNTILEFNKEVTRKEFVGRFTNDESLKRLCVPQRVRKLLEAEANSVAAPLTSSG